MRDKIEWQFFNGETDDEMISCIEKKLDIKFPTEYIECIKKYPNGEPRPDYFKFKKRLYGNVTGGIPVVTYEKNDRSLTREENGAFICNSFTKLLEMLY